jgi:hypothetical protein
MIDRAKLELFFNLLFPDLRGKEQLIEIRIKVPGRNGMVQSFYDSISELVNDMIKDEERLQECDCYFGVNPRSEKNGTKKAIKQVNALYCDVDFKTTPAKDFNSLMLSFEPKPSITIFSGGGLHLYWLIEPIKIESEQDINRVEGINKGIAKALCGDPAGADLARILRIPYTGNQKYGNTSKDTADKN